MKYKKGLVSVIIPAYNAEKYVVQAIRSVLAQTYSKWEVIIVDDGSTDKTREQIEPLIRKNIVLVKLAANGGAAKALNIGMNKARGEFIAWLAADDFYHPEMLEQAVGTMNAVKPVGLTYTDVGVFDERKIMSVFHAHYYLPSEMPERLLTDNYINSSSIVFRRELLGRTGNCDETLRYDIDGNFLYRMASVGVQFMHIPIPLVVYRKHNNSLSKDKCGMRRAIDKNRIIAITELFTGQDIFHSSDIRKLGLGWLDMAGRWASTGSYAPALLALKNARKYVRLKGRGRLWPWKIRLLYLLQRIRYAF